MVVWVGMKKKMFMGLIKFYLFKKYIYCLKFYPIGSVNRNEALLHNYTLLLTVLLQYDKFWSLIERDLYTKNIFFYARLYDSRM